MAVAIQEVETLARSFRAQTITRRANAIRQMADGSGHYWVESQGHPGEGYIVEPVAGSCTCPDYQRRRPAPCKHLLAVKATVEAERPRRKVIVENWDPTSGKVLAWRYADEPEQPRCRDCGQPMPKPSSTGCCAGCLAKGFAY